MRREEYLKTVTDQMRCKRARAAVQEEMDQHIEDQTEAFLMEGLDRENAVCEAVKEMGDPVEVGIAMDRIHRPKMAWGMIGLIAVLSLAGFILQALMQTKVEEAYFLPGGSEKQLVLLAVGLFLMTGVCYLDYTRIGKYAREITVLLWGCFIGGIVLFGAEINGAVSWIALPYLPSFNVTLGVFLFVPLYAGVLCAYRGQGYAALVKGILWMLPSLGFVLTRPNVAGTVILFFSFAIVLTVAVARDWFRVKKGAVLTALWGVIILLPVGGILYFLQAPGYQGERVRAIFGMVEGKGFPYQAETMRTVLSGSHLIGASGALNQTGVDTALLTDTSSNMLICAIAYYGILVALAVIAAMTFLFLRFLKISLRQKNQLGMLMGTGCCAVFLLQMTVYAVYNLGILNWSIRCYCPFLTYGGSGVLVAYIMLGLLLSICRYQNVVEDTRGVRKTAIREAGNKKMRKHSGMRKIVG